MTEYGETHSLKGIAYLSCKYENLKCFPECLRSIDRYVNSKFILQSQILPKRRIFFVFHHLF